MSLPRYEKYKDSGVEWLGQVPAHWELARVKHLVKSLEQGWSPQCEGFPVESADEWGVLKVGCVNGGRFRPTENKTLPPEVDPIPSLGIAAGDLLISRANTRELVGGAAVADCDHPNLLLCDKLYRLRFRAGICEPKFIAAYLGTASVRRRIELAATGASSSMLNIGQSTVLELVVALPNLEEQQEIARFLGRETAKIDGLIAEQRRLIDLLKEKRLAVASHVISKGLNPDTPMKRSGVQGLGQIPSHWTVVPLKFVAAVQTGVAKGKDNTGKEVIEVPYLRVANVQDGYLALEDMAVIEIPVADLQRYLLRAGDVLMNEGGDYDKLGRGHIWQAEVDPCIHQNHVFAVRPHGVSPEWLNTITGSGYGQFYFMTRSKQSTNLASISSTNIMELPVVLPPKAEQTKMLRFLARQTKELDALAQEAQAAIELLQERRSALISAAVTGQIDVRGAVSASAVAEDWNTVHAAIGSFADEHSTI